MGNRRKISTTVASGTYAYLHALIARGRARNLAEALDISIGGLRTLEMRARLEQDTAAYFESLPTDVAADDLNLEAALDRSADEVDFDTH